MSAKPRNASSDALERVNKRIGQARGSFKNVVNIPVLVASVALIAYGALVIWTASLSISAASFSRHLLGIGLGAMLALFCWSRDWRGLSGLSTALLVLDLAIIFSPYIPGLSYNAKGMTGWIEIPGIHLPFQPVELAKIVTVFLVGGLGAQYNGHIDSVRDYVKLCGMLAVPFCAVVAAGDLGSGLVVFCSGALIIMMSGPKKEWVLSTIAVLIGLVALLLAADSVVDSIVGHDTLIKQYQMNRLLVFLDPSSDTSGAAYNLQQAPPRRLLRDFCPRRIPTSCSPCCPRSSGLPAPWCCSRSTRCSSSRRFASRIDPIRSFCGSSPSASWASGCSRFSRTSACASGSCRSPASRFRLSASVPVPC